MSRVFIFFTLVLSIVSPAFSGQVNNATVSSLTVDAYGIVRVTLKGGTDVSAKAECSQFDDNRQFVFDLNSPSGNAWYSTFIAAQIAQKPVHVIGSNSCLSLWKTHSFEGISSIYLLN